MTLKVSPNKKYWHLERVYTLVASGSDRYPIAQNGLSFGQTNFNHIATEGTIIVMTLYLAHLKVKASSQRLTKILKLHHKGVYQMQFELRHPIVPFILLCDVWNILKYAFEL